VSQTRLNSVRIKSCGVFFGEVVMRRSAVSTMVTMNHCVATAACDEPEVDGERGYPGYEKRERKAPPEERALQP